LHDKHPARLVKDLLVHFEDIFSSDVLTPAISIEDLTPAVSTSEDIFNDDASALIGVNIFDGSRKLKTYDSAENDLFLNEILKQEGLETVTEVSPNIDVMAGLQTPLSDAASPIVTTAAEDVRQGELVPAETKKAKDVENASNDTPATPTSS
jgi:hypothetical protein